MTDSRRKTIQSAGYVVGGALLLGALLWIGFAEDKAMAILLGIAALVAARMLYVNLPEYLAENDDKPDD